MSWFSCSHKPDIQLEGESRVIDRVELIMNVWACYTMQYRQKVTNQVCRKCGVHYVTKHRIDEVSAELGPIVKPGPEQPEERGGGK